MDLSLSIRDGDIDENHRRREGEHRTNIQILGNLVDGTGRPIEVVEVVNVHLSMEHIPLMGRFILPEKGRREGDFSNGRLCEEMLCGYQHIGIAAQAGGAVHQDRHDLLFAFHELPPDFV